MESGGEETLTQNAKGITKDAAQPKEARVFKSLNRTDSAHNPHRKRVSAVPEEFHWKAGRKQGFRKCYCYRNSSYIHPAISIIQQKYSAFNIICSCIAKFWTGNKDGTLKVHCLTSSKARIRNKNPNEHSERTSFSLKVKKRTTIACCKLWQTVSPISSA